MLIKKVLIIFGTRPEAIKMAPLVKEFQKNKEFETKVCVTAQHREMLDQVLNFFDITPDYDLNLMKPNQNLFSITADVLIGLKAVLEEFTPNYIFIHGDTTTSMAASLAGFYSNSLICHVEAGLRTNNKWSPFPEEMNRQITGRIADFHFAPTIQAEKNLLLENIVKNRIVVTGNTVIDALLYSSERVKKFNNEEIDLVKKLLDKGKKTILVTGHRRENHGQGFINICEALKEIASLHEDVQIIYPVHLNPNVRKPVFDLLGNIKSIKLIEPLSYPSFVWLMLQSFIILTDSGGIQEEAPSLGKPVLVMRDTTERPEAVDAGTVILVGTDKALIVSNVNDLLTNPKRYKQMSSLNNPYGDGKSSVKIVDFIKNQLL